MDFKSISGFQVTAMRQQFTETGLHAGREAGRKVGKLALERLNFAELKEEVRKVAIASAEKYAIKAREFVKMAIRIAEESGACSKNTKVEVFYCNMTTKLTYVFFARRLRRGSKAYYFLSTYK